MRKRRWAPWWSIHGHYRLPKAVLHMSFHCKPFQQCLRNNVNCYVYKIPWLRHPKHKFTWERQFFTTIHQHCFASVWYHRKVKPQYKRTILSIIYWRNIRYPYFSARAPLCDGRRSYSHDVPNINFSPPKFKDENQKLLIISYLLNCSQWFSTNQTIFFDPTFRLYLPKRYRRSIVKSMVMWIDPKNGANAIFWCGGNL